MPFRIGSQELQRIYNPSSANGGINYDGKIRKVYCNGNLVFSNNPFSVNMTQVINASADSNFYYYMYAIGIAHTSNYAETFKFTLSGNAYVIISDTYIKVPYSYDFEGAFTLSPGETKNMTYGPIPVPRQYQTQMATLKGDVKIDNPADSRHNTFSQCYENSFYLDTGITALSASVDF